MDEWLWVAFLIMLGLLVGSRQRHTMIRNRDVPKGPIPGPKPIPAISALPLVVADTTDHLVIEEKPAPPASFYTLEGMQQVLSKALPGVDVTQMEISRKDPSPVMTFGGDSLRVPMQSVTEIKVTLQVAAPVHVTEETKTALGAIEMSGPASFEGVSLEREPLPVPGQEPTFAEQFQERFRK